MESVIGGLVFLAVAGCGWVYHRSRPLTPEDQWKILREWGERTKQDIFNGQRGAR